MHMKNVAFEVSFATTGEKRKVNVEKIINIWTKSERKVNSPYYAWIYVLVKPYINSAEPNVWPNSTQTI